MGIRLRRLVVAIAVSAIALISSPAMADEFRACWVATHIDPFHGDVTQVTLCRISGGTVVDYSSDNAVPSTLYAQTGADLTGQCWYYTSAPTSYIIIAQYADGTAGIGFDTDPGNPGGIIAIGPTLPRCTSEPVPASDPAADAWNYVIT